MLPIGRHSQMVREKTLLQYAGQRPIEATKTQACQSVAISQFREDRWHRWHARNFNSDAREA